MRVWSMVRRRPRVQAAALFAVLALAALGVYLAMVVRSPALQLALPGLSLAMTAVVLLRLMVVVRCRRLEELALAPCPGCRYSLVGLAMPVVCPECGCGCEAGVVAVREWTLDRAALARVMMSFGALPVAVGVPVAAMAARAGAGSAALEAAGTHAFAIGAVLFLPHAVCSSVVGKFFSAAVFAGYWLGGLGFGVLGFAGSLGVGGVGLLAERVWGLPAPAAAAGVGLALGAASGCVVATARRRRARRCDSLCAP